MKPRVETARAKTAHHPGPGQHRRARGRNKGRSPIPERRRQSVAWSVPHYLVELRRLRSPFDLLDWTYYKFPRFFPLRSFPTALTLEVTNECNFACPHCPRTELNIGRGIGFMSPVVLRKIAQESAGRVAEVKIIGMGEAALHPDLAEMMLTLKEHRIRTRLYTNGTLFERFLPAQICEWDLWGVVVSVDGTDAKSFRRLRVGGDYESLRANLAAFRRFRDARRHRSPLIEIRHVIMPNETPAKLRQFKHDWLGGLGDTVKFNALAPHYNDSRKEDPLRPPCRDIRREIHIRYDGRVPLCGYSGDKEWIGNVTTFMLQEIWNATRLNDVRKRHQKRDLSELSFCKTCQHR
jgi:radical SAM protein with 4Fe4S-binding SPASM domain